MQLFILSTDPLEAASFLCDRHVVKMGLEAVQILSTVAITKFNKEREGLYAPTHTHHPCVKWVGESFNNWYWALQHADAVFAEYTRRYGKRHATQEVNERLLSMGNPGFLSVKSEPIRFVQAMPDEFKRSNPVEAYRNFYKWKQTQFKMTWKPPGEKPLWLTT